MCTQTHSTNNPVIHAPITNPGRPWIRTTYQLAATIPATIETFDSKFKECEGLSSTG